MRRRVEELLIKWRRLRETRTFHDTLVFLIFVAASTLFWFILALNDSAQDSFSVRVSITNVPDSVTFIYDIPDRFHVGLRDKGTVLWRNHYRHPVLSINFKDYAEKGELRFTKADLMTSLKTIFGSSSTITSVSLDSLRLDYTTNKGKKVPVVIEANIMAASGSVIEGHLKISPASVLVYGDPPVLDTITHVNTELLALKDISETTTVKVGFRKLRDAKIVPSKVDVTVPVEPLVRKESMITVTPVNVPEHESLLLFPSKVPVDYYVAMSRLGDDDDPSIELQVDYNDLHGSRSTKLHVSVISFPDRLQNLSLKRDSVEYTIVRN